MNVLYVFWWECWELWFAESLMPAPKTQSHQHWRIFRRFSLQYFFLSNHFYLNNLVKLSWTHQSKHGNIIDIDVPGKMHNCSILYLESKMCLILRCWLVDFPYLSSSQISVSCRFSTSFSCFIKLDQEAKDSATCRPTMSHVQGMQQVI